MALEATFRQLSLILHRLHDALSALHVTVGDKPPHDETAVADALENTVFDMMGTLHESRRCALRARRAVAHPADLANARHALTVCQERFHCIEQKFASHLVSYENLNELARLGSERRAWLPWTTSMKLGIEQCRQPLEQSSTALAACWQELAEHLGTVNISVKAKSVGQQTKLAKAAATESRDLEVEGVT